MVGGEAVRGGRASLVGFAHARPTCVLCCTRQACGPSRAALSPIPHPIIHTDTHLCHWGLRRRCLCRRGLGAAVLPQQRPRGFQGESPSATGPVGGQARLCRLLAASAGGRLRFCRLLQRPGAGKSGLRSLLQGCPLLNNSRSRSSVLARPPKELFMYSQRRKGERALGYLLRAFRRAALPPLAAPPFRRRTLGHRSACRCRWCLHCCR